MERERDGGEVRREYETGPDYLRNVLRYTVEVSACLRAQMDREELLTRIVEISCLALRFRSVALYLDDGEGFFRFVSSSGLEGHAASPIQQHPFPDAVVARLIDEQYRISDSYFLSAEAPIWQDEAVSRHFARNLSPAPGPFSFSPSSGQTWLANDLLLIPLVNADEQLLGLFLPGLPLDGLRPARDTIEVIEMFVAQVAAVIESAHLTHELSEIARKAREAERAKNNFLLTASHELRTPLTAIQGYLELLGEYGTVLEEEARARFIQHARRGCDELVLLLGNVLDATYLDSAHLHFKVNPVPLASSIQTILEILEPIIAREERPVEIQIAEDLQVQADELRLRQILLNLLGNALKYTPPGSRIALNVEYLEAEEAWARAELRGGASDVARFATGPFAVLGIRDWGPGVLPMEQPLLFTKFTRLPAARQSEQRGAGLGLYLCRQLIEAMNGWIWMESSGVRGEGACFFLALPIEEI